jgi:chaperonin cofactor prefoldin
MSDGSVPHRSIFTPIEIVQLDRRVTRLEVVTESISARLDEQKVEFRDFRAEMNARFDKVDDRFDKFEGEVDNRFEKFEARVDNRFDKFEAKVDDRFERFEARVDDRFERFEARVDDRFEKFEAKVDDRFGKFEARVDDRFDRFEAKIEKTDAKFDAKFDRVDARFEEVRIHARSDFHLLFGSLIASALGLAGMMAKGFGWF